MHYSYLRFLDSYLRNNVTNIISTVVKNLHIASAQWFLQGVVICIAIIFEIVIMKKDIDLSDSILRSYGDD